MYTELQQIYWYSGLYLQPQHLQSVDLHHNYMHSRLRQLAHPWNVGMIRYDFNPDTLVDFTLKIELLQAILPSGDYLEFPGNCNIPPRQFRHAWRQLEKPFTLWLALRRFDPGHANVGDSPNSRWLKPHEETVMKDVYFNGPECSVSRILYNVQIVSDEEKQSVVDCEFLPLMRLKYEQDRVISDASFCPPLITLNGYTTLKILLDGLYAEIASRASQLAEYKRPDYLRNTADSDMTRMLAMRSLNHALPLLHHYCRTPTIHPWAIYGLLVQLIGELSCFNEQCNFNGDWQDEAPLGHYDHYDLFSCFSAVRNRIVSLLNNLSLGNNSWVTLHADEQCIFRSSLQTVPWGNTGSVLLALYSENLNTDEPLDCSHFKIASDSSIKTLILHALPGVSANRLNVHPAGIPYRKNTLYFCLEQTEKLWRNIASNLDIAFYWDSAPSDLQVQVIFMENNHVTV